MRFVTFLVLMFFTFAETPAVPIDTPDTDERNDFIIRCPDGWGYRTFKGENGLIGVFWPKGTSFNLTDTAIFVFLQDKSKPLPKIADNINLFMEKCTKAQFKCLPSEDQNNPTKSLGERYFRGRCGRTMVIIEESVENYNIVILIASAKAYITKKQLSDLKEIANAYKREAEEYVKKANSEDEDEEEPDNSSENQNAS